MYTFSYNCIAAYIFRFLCFSVLNTFKFRRNFDWYMNYLAYYYSFLIHAANALKIHYCIPDAFKEIFCIHFKGSLAWI